MIYLTGDVHTRIPGHWEQESGGSEIDSAKEYLEILKKYKISCTLFINGKCIKKDFEKVKSFLGYNAELGGHTYDNFGEMNLFKSYFYRKFFGCVYGPAYLQKKDIIKTKKSFKRLGIEMSSWRTHAFGSNEKTFKILKSEGVGYISDLFGERPFEKDGIVHMPINIPTDVNTISYGELKPENRNPFASCTKGRIKPKEWLDILKKRVIENEKNKIDSVILIHPITMKVLDNFKMFRQIAEFLSRYESKKISEFEG